MSWGIAWSDLSNTDMYTITRFYNHSVDRKMAICRRQCEGKFGDDEGEDNLQLDHGKVATKA